MSGKRRKATVLSTDLPKLNSMQLSYPRAEFALSAVTLIASLASAVACGSGGPPGERQTRRLLDEHLAANRKSYACVDLRTDGHTPGAIETLLELGWIRAGESSESFEILDAGRPFVLQGACTPDALRYVNSCGRFHSDRGSTPREMPSE